MNAQALSSTFLTLTLAIVLGRVLPWQDGPWMPPGARLQEQREIARLRDRCLDLENTQAAAWCAMYLHRVNRPAHPALKGAI
jgi:hypothetical protein